jgi:hypothetical protein
MALELLPHDGRYILPYAEATSGNVTVNTNTFYTVNLTSSVYDNGAVTTGSALVDLTGDTIKLRRAGVWFFHATCTWSADATGTGYRVTAVAADFFGGTWGHDVYSNNGRTGAITQSSSGGITNVGSNTGYGAYVSLYHNSSSASLTANVTLRATWLAPHHA